MNAGKHIRAARRAKMSLRDFINEKGQSQVARDLGVTNTYICKLKSGEKPVSAKMLARASAVYGVLFDVEATLREMRAGDMGQPAPAATAAWLTLVWPAQWTIVARGRAILPLDAEPDPKSWTRVSGPLWRFELRETVKDMSLAGYSVHKAVSQAGAVTWRLDSLAGESEPERSDGVMELAGCEGAVYIEGGIPVRVMAPMDHMAAGVATRFMRYSSIVEREDAWLDLGKWQLATNGLFYAPVVVEANEDADGGAAVRAALVEQMEARP